MKNQATEGVGGEKLLSEGGAQGAGGRTRGGCRGCVEVQSRHGEIVQRQKLRRGGTKQNFWLASMGWLKESQGLPASSEAGVNSCPKST